MKKEIKIPKDYEIDISTFKKVEPNLPMKFEDLDDEIIHKFFKNFWDAPKKYQAL